MVRVGEWELKSVNEPYPHSNYEVDYLKIHPNYVAKTSEMENNIGLVFTKNLITYYPHIRPICLPSKELKFNEEKCLVSGWGKSRFDDKKNHVIMKEIELPIYNREKCEDNIRFYTRKSINFKNWKLHESSICAGGEEGVGK